MNKLFIVCILSGIGLNLTAQKLSKEERKICDLVDKNLNSSLLTLEKVVNINSGTMNFEGVREVGKVFDEEFSKIGFETKWIDLQSVNRSGHLFAEKRGKKGKRLLLIGHLDTVFEKEDTWNPFTILNDSTATGQGVNDMKGGDVIVLFALKALHEAGFLKDTQIIVAFTGDEENTGDPLEISRKDLIEAAKRSDIGLCFETATGFNHATVARRGSSGWKLETTGKRAHSSGIFNESTGAGAIFEMSRILHAFYSEVRGEQYLTFNPGVMLGGSEVAFDEALSKGTAFGKDNVVPQTAVVTGGLRFISEEQKEKARQKMRDIVSENLPQTSAKITFYDSYPAMPPSEKNFQLLSELSKISQDLGLGTVEAYDPGRRGAADISFVAEYVAALDGLGAMGRGAHAPGETINLATFDEMTKRVALLIYRLTR